MQYIEHYFPAKEAQDLGIDVETFGKIAAFFIKQLQSRQPKRQLSVHFRSEIIALGTLNSKSKRKNWLDAFAKARQLQYVPVPKPAAKSSA